MTSGVMTPDGRLAVLRDSRAWSTWRQFRRNRAALLGAAIVAILAVVALFANVLPLADPEAFAARPYLAPSPAHPFGTDNLGRDVFSRVIYGARIAFIVAIGAAGIATALGVVFGASAGYLGGWADDVLSRTFDIFLLIPAFFLLVLIVALFGQGIIFIVIVIGLTTWPRSARIMRSQVLSYRGRNFVQAAQAAGANGAQTLAFHIVPNSLAPVITDATILMGSAILVEAGLSFLGLGDPNTISWGRMILDGRTYLSVAPWMSLFPGLAMFALVLALNLVGDGLAYALDPKLRTRSAPRGRA
jgi:peptide/nickel transport system permease protein